jgi:GNAT superfamily N-acetyltransferase
MSAATDTPIEVRRAVPADRRAVLGLLAASLGWSADDQFDAFFTWKHDANPFGSSPAWVAVADQQVVGFRTFLRWEFIGAQGEVRRAVRAVDTATHPDFQGRGIFRRLTLEAVDGLVADRVDFVFNTPNAQSRPGYLKMGWSELGRLPTAVRLASPASLTRVAHARVPAGRWSTESSAGRSASDVLSDPRLADLLASTEPNDRLRTNRTVEFMRWRYGFGRLAYRAMTLSDDLADGVALFRLRQRGAALECALCDVVVPAGGVASRRALVKAVVRTSGADYTIRLGRRVVDRLGFVRLPRQGPTLLWRPLTENLDAADLDRWDLVLGDIELF